MKKRIDAVSDAQMARVSEWVREWTEIGLSTKPADRETFESAVAKCYSFAGLEPPKRVIWLQSPLAVSIAGPVASYALAVRGALAGAVGGAVDRAVRGAVYGAVAGAVADAVYGAVDGAVDRAVRGAVYGAVAGAVDRAVAGAVAVAVADAVYGAVDGAVARAVRGAVDGAVARAVRGAVDGAVARAVYGAVDGAVADAVYGAVDGAVADAVYGAMAGAVDGTLSGAVRGAVGGAVEVAVDRAVDSAVGGAVEVAMAGAVEGAVADAVADAVYGAVDRAVDGTLSGAVGGAVEVAVAGAVDRAVLHVIRDAWWRRIGGQFWASWPALERFYAEVCRLELPDDLTARGAAYADTVRSAGWWWPHKDFVIASERPVAIHLANGRLHSSSGPAIEWGDGFGVYALNGVHVPGEWITQQDSIDPRVALTHPNVEQRRVLREFIGWKRILEAVGGARIIAGDPLTREGAIIEIDLRDDGENPARFLQAMCPSGENKQICERVDPSCNTPLEANAWSLGISVDQYSSNLRT